MKFTSCKIKSIIAMLSLIILLSSMLSCSNTTTETTPPKPESSAEDNFIIVVSTPVKDAADIWTVTISVTSNVFQSGQYHPLDIYSGSISVSFPDISNISNIMPWNTSMDQGFTLIPTGEQISTNYDEGAMIQTKYPVLEAKEGFWEHGVTRVFTFKVLPEKNGTFTFYIKAKGEVLIENVEYVSVYTPAAGTKDQQMEYVEVHTFTVN